MKEYLFVFTIGPVKSFINHARKAQDLFAGSAILSYLSGKAIEKAIELFEQEENILVTPLKDTEYKPNRFVLKVAKNNGIDFKEIGNKLEQFTKDSFIAISNSVLPDTEPFTCFQEQLQNYLEIYWVFVPINNGNYKEAYHNVFKELATQKNIIPFTQQEEIGRKCSVDGEHNVTFYRKRQGENLAVNTRTNRYNKLFLKNNEVNVLETNDKNLLQIWHIDEGEGLSAISLTKRIFNKENPDQIAQPHQFPSTVGIALMDLFDQLKDEEDFKKYKEEIVGDVMGEEIKNRLFTHSDEQLYFEENINAKLKDKALNNKELIPKNMSVVEYVSEQHNKLKKIIEEKGIKNAFTKYYALVRFDGDHMGDWLLGNYVKDDINLEKFHRAFTECVHQFGMAVNQSIQEPIGKVIYAGGEDFMAMINIHHLTAAMRSIHQLYHQKIDQKLAEFKKDQNKTFTISMGVAIAHYKQPLGMVLQKAKEMEALAKDSGRNRYGLGVIKHSGNVLQTVVPWDNDCCESLCMIEEILKHLELGNISTAFLRNIYAVFEEYGFDFPADILKTKIDLYVPRAVNNIVGIDVVKVKNSIKHITHSLYSVFEYSARDVAEFNKNFGELLLILDFISRKTAEK